MLFTKTDSKRGLTSPKEIFSGNGKTLIPEQVMNDFKMMRGNDGGFGTTDLIEALDKAVETIKQETGIIWLVTDNINDNSGSGDSSYFNTLEFYKRLRNDNNIKKILLYPIPEKVTEAGFTSNGYVVYGIVYSKVNLSQIELEKYDAKLRSIGIKQKAITLKPLDVGTVVLNPKVTQSKIAPGKLYYDGKTLRGYDFEEGERVKETFNDLTLKSTLYPYTIRSAKLDVRLENFKSSDYSVKSLGTQSISPSTVSNVSPEGEVTGFSILFNMPEITPTFSFNTIFKEDFSVGGNLVLEVSQVDILLDEGYMNSFRELFALQSVPEIFKPVLKDKKIVTQIPLEIRMKYGPWRLFALIGILVFIGAIVFIFIYLLLKKKSIAVVIDNSEETSVNLSFLSSYSVSKDYSFELGKIKKSLFGNIKFTYSKFTSTPGVSVKLSEGVPVTIDYEDENMRKNNVTLMIKSTIEKREFREVDKSNFY
jgi:calcineurin-like phosphoesterase family protein